MNSVIDKLQNYFGIAIKSNVNNLKGMKSAIATVASTDDNLGTNTGQMVPIVVASIKETKHCILTYLYKGLST